MKVLHVIPSVSLQHGGPSRAIRLMEYVLLALGLTAFTLTTDDDGRRRRLPLAQCSNSSRHYARKWCDFYKVAPEVIPWLYRHINRYDIVHIHALFSFTSVVAAWMARRAGVPYIIRPLGVLNQYGLTQRRPWLKRLSIRFIEGPILRHAAAVHFTAQAELEEAKATGIDIRGVVIPLGVEAVAAGEKERFLAAYPGFALPLRLLFLSRLDPKKNLEGLLGALALLRAEGANVALIIAGDGEAGYVAQLHELAAELNVADHVTWLGHVEGRAKADALAAADLFVLPSHSENFGIAVVEALVAGLPCVVGHGVAISAAVEQAGAGTGVGTDAASIAAGIRRYLQSEEMRRTTGNAARVLARREYSVEKMGERLVGLYRKTLDERSRIPHAT